MSVGIVGGDSFLEVTAAPGHTVLVPGYFDEPYLRIDADNSVWVNRNSPAYYINQDRYGQTAAPDDASADAPRGGRQSGAKAPTPGTITGSTG